MAVRPAHLVFGRASTSITRELQWQLDRKTASMTIILGLAFLAFVLRRVWVLVVGALALRQLNEVAEGFRAPY